MKWPNPFAFRPGPVTLWTTVVYLAVVIPLLYVHERVPRAPADGGLGGGLNLSEAWGDLQTMTRTYHPYNSHENDRVRAFLMERAKQIVRRNGVDVKVETTGGVAWRRGTLNSPLDEAAGDDARPVANPPAATIFDDRISNVTYTFRGAPGWVGQYFEGSNLYVYIHGKEDPAGDWWKSEEGLRAARRTGGVLVNCHFDSVSTGYGATDDGMACVSMLQLLSHFTSKGHQPKNGIVLLFNNGEEDGLLGARAFGYSPLLDFIHTFVNLEGAAAGGRAMLFRTTDLQAAEAYAGSPHPFGSVVAADAFKRGLVKSGTDYEVFADAFGQRGMDIAFYEPRSRYHTAEDDARHTSVDSLWHMLSSALASTQTLSETTSVNFNGPRADERKDLVQNGRPTEGVWFDWFGSALAVFPLRGLFAWSLTLLVATPLLLLLVTYFLVRNDKFYLFARNIKTYSEFDEDPVPLGGWRGFFRFPLALLVSSASTVASVYLVAKFNPLIIYSSGYAIWAMTMSLFYLTFWLVMRGACFVRPSALQRAFAILWLFILAWVMQVFAAVAEDRMHMGSLYFVAFLHTAVFLAMLVSLLEMFALPGKREFARQVQDGEAQDRDAPYHDGQDGDHAEESESAQQAEQEDEDGSDAEAATETTPFTAGERGYRPDTQTTFAGTYRRTTAAGPEGPASAAGPSMESREPYEHEQSWSGQLPTWTWFVQLLLLAPVHVIILGNLGLVATTATSMTGVDGSSLLTPLMGIGIISMLLLLPLSPFIHRVTHHIPVFLLFVLLVMLIYNLAAFPFSANNRFKFKFQQTVDLDEKTNVVKLTGLEEYVRPVMASLPTPRRQKVSCRASDVKGLTDCMYDASPLAPDPADGEKLEKLVSVETAKASDGRTIKVHIRALNSRMCFLDISDPVFGFSVQGGGRMDDRFGGAPRDGFQHFQLWRRTWDGSWNVTLQLTKGDYGSVYSSAVGDAARHKADEGAARPEADDVDEVGDGELKVRRTSPLQVSARCVWDDANMAATQMPALHEVLTFMPQWAIVTKKTIGLVEVKRSAAST